jgi:hypothetical protein
MHHAGLSTMLKAVQAEVYSTRPRREVIIAFAGIGKDVAEEKQH